MKAPQWQDCRELTLQLDAQRTAYAMAPLAQHETVGITESLRGQVALSALEALARAQRAELELCGSAILLSASVRSQARTFVRRFRVLERTAAR